MTDDCPFCDIIAGRADARIVGETPGAIAFFPLRPAALGHTLVIPKRHVANIWKADREIVEQVAWATAVAAQALRRALSPDGLNIINSTGEAASQTVFHLHVHLVPRWSDDHIGNLWPPSEPWSEEVKDNVAELVRDDWVDL
jgi:histidine triad (HIT) family protein